MKNIMGFLMWKLNIIILIHAVERINVILAISELNL